jgi:hypothetical protein
MTKLSTVGQSTLAAMRAGTNDPAMSADARAKRREKARTESLASRAWERGHLPVDPTAYEREVRPAIERMSVPELMKVTGLSQFYCWKVRKGDRRLHGRHWEAVLRSTDET